MCFNVGIVIGPILGGVLADPLKSYPGVFGPDSFLGGKDGVWWMRMWPYALPNVLSALVIFSAALAVFLGLEEVCSWCCFLHIPQLTVLSRHMKSLDTAQTGESGFGKQSRDIYDALPRDTDTVP